MSANATAVPFRDPHDPLCALVRKHLVLNSSPEKSANGSFRGRTSPVPPVSMNDSQLVGGGKNATGKWWS